MKFSEIIDGLQKKKHYRRTAWPISHMSIYYSNGFKGVFGDAFDVSLEDMKADDWEEYIPLKDRKSC